MPVLIALGGVPVVRYCDATWKYDHGIGVVRVARLALVCLCPFRVFFLAVAQHSPSRLVQGQNKALAAQWEALRVCLRRLGQLRSLRQHLPLRSAPAHAISSARLAKVS
jgi:hypothetical protein